MDETRAEGAVPEQPEPNTTEIWDGGGDGAMGVVALVLLVLFWWLARGA